MAKQLPSNMNRTHPHHLAAARDAGQPARAAARAAARKLHDDEELQQAQLADQADEAVMLADASDAAAAAPAEATAGAGGVMMSEGATLSPLAIGAGVLGVVAVAAAAGGGGGSSGNDRLSLRPPTDTAPQDKPQGKPVVDDPAPVTGPAVAQGEVSSPQVAVNGITRLNAESFKQAAVEGTELEFVRIDRILAADGTDPEARVIRFGNDTPPAAGQSGGVSASGTLLLRAVAKAEGEDGTPGGAPAASQMTAYEVIRVEGGITREEAAKRAAATGGKLLEINDAAEMSWLNANLFGVLGPVDGDTSAEAGHLSSHGAWMGSSRIAGADARHDAIKRAGDPNAGLTTHDATPETLSHFVIEYDNYQSPLGILGADGQVTPILEGQTVRVADLDKLVWNGDQNKVGAIRLQAVLTNEGSEAEVVPGSQPLTLAISESAAVKPAPITPPAGNGQGGEQGDAAAGAEGAGHGNEEQTDDAHHQGGQEAPAPAPTPAGPDYQNNVSKPEYSVPLDSVRLLSPSLFQGADLSQQPHFIRITAVEQAAPASGEQTESALILHRGSGHHETVLDVGAEVHRNDFGKISWNAQQNQGGKFRFEALDEHHQKIAGIPEQAITIYEQPLPPAYGPDNSRLFGVGKDSPYPFGALTFQGDDEARIPDRIKIIGVKEDNDTDQAHSALVHRTSTDAEGNNHTFAPLKAGDVIQKADFDHIEWHTLSNTGGSFSFVALDKHGNHLGKVQTVRVYELPDAPDYSQQPERATISHNAQAGMIDRAFFDGADKAKAPSWIGITAVTEMNDTNTGTTALSVMLGGVSKLDVTPRETVIAASDFGNLRWDASSNTGGSIRFRALDEHLREISGSPEQTITIHEQQAAPSYQNNYFLTLSQDNNASTTTGHHKLNESLFTGSVDANQPAFIRITNVHAITDDHQRDDKPVLYKAGATDTDSKIALTAEELLAIPQADFGKLYWDSTHNVSGYFDIQALDEYRTPIAGASTTVRIAEQASLNTPDTDSANGMDQQGNASTEGATTSDTMATPGNTTSDSTREPADDVQGAPAAGTPTSPVAGSGGGTPAAQSEGLSHQESTADSPADGASVRNGATVDDDSSHTAGQGNAAGAGNTDMAAAAPEQGAGTDVTSGAEPPEHTESGTGSPEVDMTSTATPKGVYSPAIELNTLLSASVFHDHFTGNLF